ncbi:MAG: adenylate kinase family protein [Candidatus Aenigmatarchaeota archaeon]
MKLLIFGPPGSGKGTYSSEIEERIDVEHIATGDMFREAVKKDTELGNKVEEYLDKGELVPDELVNEVVREKLKEMGMEGFILDGYPRTVEQAKFLENLVDIDALILLDVTDEIIIERLSSRRICKECGEVFNKLFNPPEEEGVCDECGGKLYQRKDDKPDVIRDRIDTYEERSEPVINYFEGKIPFVVNKCREANAPIDGMVDNIIEGLKEKDLV